MTAESKSSPARRTSLRDGTRFILSNTSLGITRPGSKRMQGMRSVFSDSSPCGTFLCKVFIVNDLPLDFACKLLIIHRRACKVFFLNELAPEHVRGFACFFDLYPV